MWKKHWYQLVRLLRIYYYPKITQHNWRHLWETTLRAKPIEFVRRTQQDGRRECFCISQWPSATTLRIEESDVRGSCWSKQRKSTCRSKREEVRDPKRKIPCYSQRGRRGSPQKKSEDRKTRKGAARVKGRASKLRSTKIWKTEIKKPFRVMWKLPSFS